MLYLDEDEKPCVCCGGVRDVGEPFCSECLMAGCHMHQACMKHHCRTCLTCGGIVGERGIHTSSHEPRTLDDLILIQDGPEGGIDYMPVAEQMKAIGDALEHYKQRGVA